MSAFSFASFCGKPVYGIWVDKGGNKFRIPYIASFGLAILGAIIFFFANTTTTTIISSNFAVGMIFMGRLLGGLGGANQALGFAYLAEVIPLQEQTKTSTILSMMRIVGMTIGPVVNVGLAKIHTTINFFGLMEMNLDPLNSVGIVLAVGNLIAMISVIFFLEEPPPKPKKMQSVLDSTMGKEVDATTLRHDSIWGCFFTIDILLPIFILLVVNSSFQLYVMQKKIKLRRWRRARSFI